jgi:hypothetical protein
LGQKEMAMNGKNRIMIYGPKADEAATLRARRGNWRADGSMSRGSSRQVVALDARSLRHLSRERAGLFASLSSQAGAPADGAEVSMRPRRPDGLLCGVFFLLGLLKARRGAEAQAKLHKLERAATGLPLLSAR